MERRLWERDRKMLVVWLILGCEKRGEKLEGVGLKVAAGRVLVQVARGIGVWQGGRWGRSRSSLGFLPQQGRSDGMVELNQRGMSLEGVGYSYDM
jgi:hypothetical protein